MGFSLDRGIGTAFVDEVAGDDGVVVDYLVSWGQHKHLLLISVSFPLGYEDLDIGEGLAGLALAGLVAERGGAELLGEG